MMLSPSGRSRRGSSSHTAGTLSILSCSAWVTGIADVSLSCSDRLDPQLLLHDPRQWRNLLMKARCEDHACERDARRFRIENSYDHPVTPSCDRCLHLYSPSSI